ncbi:hypothetical protein D3OALGB2SA_113 [Olavius algarvensis associated proteobacterium Delta 3]|nr:hypothetical protein D3OALGB2SA_113 [Olavius algarvensis associated proteobacterium Delta 3]
MKVYFLLRRFVLCCVWTSLLGRAGFATDLPGNIPDLPPREGAVRNPLTWEDLHRVIGSDSPATGLRIDLQKNRFSGRIFSAPYPMEVSESDFDYPWYRAEEMLRNGRGTIPVSFFFNPKYNVNDWAKDDPEPIPTYAIGYRLDLRDEKNSRQIGFYDARINFDWNPEHGPMRTVTITEGPFLNVSSDDPSQAIISLETDRVTTALVSVTSTNGIPVQRVESGQPKKRHEISVGGLKAGSDYLYRVRVKDGQDNVAITRRYSFQTAPAKGNGDLIFGFSSDSREGPGGGERTYMGSNRHVLNTIVRDAFRRDARLFLFGGDLVNGYTSQVEDFKLQLKGWKQAFEGFWRTRSVYTAMGNHETVLNVYEDGSYYGISLDKWPYATDSAEALFAREFVNPTNGPTPSDPRRPSYRENVYRFQYGPVLFIAFNNNYWWTSCDPHLPDTCRCREYGGSPEGYILEDQLNWIESALEQAELDASVRFIFLFAQEPVFPAGGHVTDAMWWHGNNRIRAYTKSRDSTRVLPETLGIIEVRNRLWRAVAGSSKVAAVLTSDEHAYHRTLIDATTPVGRYPEDDLDGDGKLDRASPNPAFIHPTWHVTCGAAGAPFHNREPTPWRPAIFSSQSGYTLIRVSGDRASLQFITVTGQVVDAVPNLMAVKLDR